MTRISSESDSRPRVLYSFPFKVGAERICTTAWHQAAGVAREGIDVTVLTGSVARPLPTSAKVLRTLSLGPLRVPYRLLGRTGTCRLHDRRVASWLRAHAEDIDLVHAWPLASLETIRVAKSLGIPVMLERINAHIRFAFEIVTEECGLIGVNLPPGHDHELNLDSLAREEREYAEADYLLCPSEFVARSFLELGCPEEKILRHHYGFDQDRFSPAAIPNTGRPGLTMIYAGVCEPRKGLHYALEAWFASGAHENGKFRICGNFVPGYAERISELLSHPSVEVLGHRSDLPDLMRESDVFILPSVEEGSALVTYEARGSGCVLVVSENAGAVCKDQHDGLIHPIRDVKTLTNHLAMLDREPQTLARMRKASLDTVKEITWTAAGRRLAEVYRTLTATAAETSQGLPGRQALR